jgi:hypothetical protein
MLHNVEGNGKQSIMGKSKNLVKGGYISLKVFLGHFPGQSAIKNKYCQKKVTSVTTTPNCLVSTAPDKTSAEITGTDRLTYPHEICQQGETKGPVQLDLVLHQNVL